MKTLDLFSGIGGFSLGLEAAGFSTVAFCEIDSDCRRLLSHRWPGVPIYDDIQTLTADRLRSDGVLVEAICGGFPCQDISTAGSGQGLDGERSGLWREYFRLICELRPSVVLVENSSALLYRGLGTILGQLAEIGYNAEWHCLRASSIGAPFAGDRVYILAAADTVDGKERMGFRAPIIDARTIQLARSKYRASVWLETTSRSARMGDGFSDFVDRRRRTEQLGNAVVPQIPEILGRAILEARAA